MKDKKIDNSLLLRQIRKYLGSVDNIQEEMEPIFLAINQSYNHYEGDRELIERAMDLSSEELSESNTKLKQQVDIHVKTLQKVKESLATLEIEDSEFVDGTDLVKLAEYLQSEINQRRKAEKELKASRKRYKLLIETAQDIIYRVNKKGVFLYMNPVAYRLLGYSAKEIRKMNYVDLIRSDHQKRVVNFYKKQVKDLRESTYLEFPIQTKNEKEIWIGQNVQLITEDGEFQGIQAVARDITEIHRVSEDLKAAKKEAEESSKAKEIFLANMSHEIRTPMNAIIGMARLLQKTELDSEQKKYLQAISTASNNLIVLINDILNLSKIESGKLEIEDLGFRIIDLLESIYYSQKIIADSKKLDFSYSLDPSVPWILRGDPYRFNQVLTNLINNAIKFTQHGYVELNVKLLEKVGDEHRILFSIKDSGIGIPEDKLGEIFDSFSQADNSVTRKFGGTGLGLSISKSLVQMMNGELSVESTLGEGTEFSVIIPFKEAKEVDVNIEQDFDSRSLELKGMNVLLVEDNHINKLVVSTLFDKWGIHYDWGENGEEALEFLKKKKYDIILMDIQMPIMSGLEATEIIRKDLKLNLPIIALTAHAFKEDEERCIESGMDDVIVKPFEPFLLFNKMLNQLYIKGKTTIN
ncbi:ATP-binding protein [Rhodohalobacter sp. 614A]|uniref:ATP-binding protein n=1 Tax=Rhodohalobacter sp. 614A TaxID=2908649 RepID=UPI001F1CBF0A|nr:ATP-binding protein [Rhodohalobacter sp. 614A]